MTLALSQAQANALVQLRLAYPELQVVLVGAAALSAHVALPRSTGDVDLLLVASIADFTPWLSRLGWQQDPKQAHRWRCGGNALADVLPASDDVLRSGLVRFDDFVMNAQGLDLALRHTTRVLIPGHEVSIDVATLPALIVLKVVAWLDRPQERGKDLDDLAHLLEHALADDDERRWDPAHPVGALELPHDEQSAFHAGLEVGRIAQPEHRRAIASLLDTLRDEEGAEFARMLRASRGVGTDDAVAALQRRLHAFELGLG